MLNREEAQKRLKTFEIKSWEKDRLAAVAKLAERPRTVGRVLLDRDAAGKAFKGWEARGKANAEAQKLLAAMPAKERQALFAALYPKLATAIERTWSVFPQLPYEAGYCRKGFRNPGDESAHTEVRFNWLQSIARELKGYDPDVVWCATWAAHLGGGYGNDSLGLLLAAAVSAGGTEGDEVFEILKESATNQHEIGSMGRHVTRALLASARPAAWEYVEKLLLAAQRQEGLRQVILEAIDEAHPQAFRRMLKLILEENLLRFSATVRAIDVWFGLQWSALTPAVLRKAVADVLRYLEDPAACTAAIEKETGEGLYLALWAIAFDDAAKAIEPAARLLKDPSVERRYVALKFLDDLELPAARQALVPAIDDEDLRIAVSALEKGPQANEPPDLWDAILRLLDRMPAKTTQGEALVWPWATVAINRQAVAGELVDRLGKRPATTLVPYLRDLASYHRGNVVEQLAKLKKWDAATRDTLFELAGDRDGWVREKALKALKKCDVTEADAVRVEALLTRKGSELRQGVLSLLRKQTTPHALASADRLLTSKKQPQRAAGLELLRLLVDKKKAVPECRARAEAYRQAHPTLTEDEDLQLEAILDVRRERPTLQNALGLMDPAARTPAIEPKARKVTLCTPAALACLKALDDLIHQHRETAIQVSSYDGQEEVLLGNAFWRFPEPESNKPIEPQLEKLPLSEVWKGWYDSRTSKQLDKDGLELIRAMVWWNIDAGDLREMQKGYGKRFPDWVKLFSGGQKPPKLRYGLVVGRLINWLLRLHPPAGAVDFLLDVVETGYASVPDEERKRAVPLNDWMKRQKDWRCSSPIEPWWDALTTYRRLLPAAWTDEHTLRLWDLHHWRDEPAPGVSRIRPDFDLFLAAWKAKRVNENDFFDQVLGPAQDSYVNLRVVTAPASEPLKQCPDLAPLAERARERILEIELKRGEMPTAASGPAGGIAALRGVDTLRRLLAALGKKPLSRSPSGEGRTEVLSRLVQVTLPAASDTPAVFAAAAKADGWTRERLLQLAFAAPQWLDAIEHAVGWPGLKEGVWWFLAHTPGGRSGIVDAATLDDGDYGDDEFGLDDLNFDDEDDLDTPQEAVAKVDPWEKAIRERTSLSPEERSSGAVDAAWFQRIYPPLGRKRWDEIAAAAKYGTSYGSGHKKATLLADAMLGRAKKSEFIRNIRDRKLKEPVRLLGLMPLPAGESARAELLSRYKVLLEYRRYVRTLGPMSREDAERTSAIGFENLARTAGYSDPVRLEWAMEAKQIADLAAGPVSVTQDGVTVTLAITTDAQPEVTVRRGEKPLKAVPPAVRKHPKIAALVERKADLKRQASRVRQSLEGMMVRGDTFSGDELRNLFEHPLVRPVLERLVVLGEGITGYPIAGGQALEDHSGKREPVKHDERLRFAHPHDLFAAGEWDKWQHDCFARERVQPFKQVFRELYVPTAQEKTDAGASHRYHGQQVNPRQAMALWGSRGWATSDEISKTFHDAGIVAEVFFRHHGWTPAQVEGLTLEAVRFRRRGEFKVLPLEEVPPRLFSEVMRDCDLVVSVAHVGGVDPEASASTVEMRSALVRETCALLNITNTRVSGNHLLIDGRLGTYSVHLGSGVVHRQPGGSVCIVPVHSQHRGRLFLPFADDDPRTAEVISKVLLLARDDQIQDPTILEQLR
ncbi:MAG: DUF5724 domain-containing protein [Gemmataceae bacterium]